MKMKTLITLLLFVSPIFGMNFEEMQAIVAKEHDDADLVPELSIFSKGREFEVTMVFTYPHNNTKTTHTVKIDAKIVDGKYEVVKFDLPNGFGMTLITEYDSDNQCYTKWIWQKGDKEARKMTGVALGRSVSWVLEYETPKGVVKSNGVESHTDDSTEWIESYFLDGKILHSMRGSAKKIR